jgi:hypothetical protein
LSRRRWRTIIKAVVIRATTLVQLSAALGLAAASLLGFGADSAEAAGRRSDVMPVDQVKRGMKGYGLTVFQGTKPERFDVEVIDVLPNFRPRQPLILVKTQHPRLEVAKVVAGMSGSPIYLQDKMVGAYAYGWTFGVEAVAGVTPIQNMLDEMDRPLPKLINGWKIDLTKGASRKPTAALAGSGSGRYAKRLDQYDVREHAAEIAAARRSRGLDEKSPLRPVATPLLVGGMSAGAIEVARELVGPLGLEPLQAGGGGGATDPDAPQRFVDGGAIGVQLIRGDMSAMGLGTVTRVEGDSVAAFGHPMMESGVTALPTAIGQVLWFMASEARSFKIGMPVRPVGALVNDRMAAIVVSHRATAPVIPVSMKIRGVPGAPHTDWTFEVAHEKFMAPSFLAVALGNALQASASDRQDVSWNAKAKVQVEGHAPIEIEDFGVSVGGTPDSQDFTHSNLVRAVGAILNNPWQPTFVKSVSVDIELRYAREIYRLRGVEVLDQEIEAGKTARLRLTLVPFAGAAITRVVKIPIPPHLAGKTVTLTIRPGHVVSRERAAPENLADLISTLVDPVYPPKSVVVSYSDGGAITYRGKVATSLPPGAFDALQPRSASVAPVPFKSETRHVTPLEQFMVGHDSVRIQVKPVLD